MRRAHGLVIIDPFDIAGHKTALSLLLRLELLKLLILPLDLSLLRRKLLLHGLVLLLARLHLVTDQGSADQAYSSADTGAGAGVAGGAADDRTEPRAGKSSDPGALFPGGERLRAADKHCRHKNY